MARKPDVQYIRYYTDGSAARQLELKPQRQKRPLPKTKQKPQYVLYIQPMAIIGIVLSAVMLIMMVAGSVELFHAKNEQRQMKQHVGTLSSMNAAERAKYEESLDLETIEKSALALGMVPQDQVKHMTISVPMPEMEEEPGIWEKMISFLEGLFA